MLSCFIRSIYNSLVTCMLKVKAICGVSMHISCACALLCDALQQFSGKTFWALVCVYRVRHNRASEMLQACLKKFKL
ncbi:hypothetical protein BpHYR1_033299 [Brachionus plicatilis]|uniref:Uncharacterized protein n=1 Tax=Brachionus plicatilis TaxID=10195 RepID=A0A3M7S7I6_BRAPC|nr:hypothetical protein BpHYR1_033299 [Brachionus plicatilis]